MVPVESLGTDEINQCGIVLLIVPVAAVVPVLLAVTSRHQRGANTLSGFSYTGIFNKLHSSSYLFDVFLVYGGCGVARQGDGIKLTCTGSATTLAFQRFRPLGLLSLSLKNCVRSV